MRPIRVLNLAYYGGLGGGEAVLLSHLAAMDRRAFDQRVICATPGAFVDELRKLGFDAKVLRYPLPRWRGGGLPAIKPAVFLRLWSYLKKHRIELVHCKDPESSYYAAPLARILKIPVVWTCWGWWHAEDGWKTRYYEYFYAAIVTPTRSLKQALVQANPRLAARIKVIPFGVDVQAFTPGARDMALMEELHLPHQAPIVTQVARWQPVKGHGTFLEAARLILDVFPETRFLLVGGNAFDTREGDEYAKAIEEMISCDARLAARVLPIGFRRDLPRILRSSTVLVCPSKFETYGVANLEAMACGISVVSTDIGGPSETVVDGETGFLVGADDPRAIAERVCTLLADPELRAKLGANGRRRVEQDFALDASARQMEQLYRQLVTRTAFGDSPRAFGMAASDKSLTEH